MLRFDEILFAVSLAFGGCLVLGSALGMGELFTSPELDASSSEGLSEGDGSDPWLLSFFGVGAVPLAIVMMLLSLLFGAAGLSASPWLRGMLGDDAGSWLALGLAAAVAAFGTAVSTRFLARVLPAREETYASHKRELVGGEAVVVVCGRDGTAVLRAIDPGGAELRVCGRSASGELRVGERVLVVAYDPVSDCCQVEKLLAR